MDEVIRSRSGRFNTPSVEVQVWRCQRLLVTSDFIQRRVPGVAFTWHHLDTCNWPGCDPHTMFRLLSPPLPPPTRLRRSSGRGRKWAQPLGPGNERSVVVEAWSLAPWSSAPSHSESVNLLGLVTPMTLIHEGQYLEAFFLHIDQSLAQPSTSQWK